MTVLFERIGKRLDFDLLNVRQEGPDPDWASYFNFLNYLKETTPWVRGMISKHQAQVIFFRNMMSISALTAFICIIMEFPSRWNSLLPLLLSHHRRYAILSILSLFLFLLCWRVQTKALKEGWLEFFKRSQEPKGTSQA